MTVVCVGVAWITISFAMNMQRNLHVMKKLCSIKYRYFNSWISMVKERKFKNHGTMDNFERTNRLFNTIHRSSISNL